MVTPELVGYIKGEFAKGRSREDIHAELVKSGGWGEADLSEAFRSILPIQNVAQNSNIRQVSVSSKTSPRFLKIVLIIVLSVLLGFVMWFYRSPLTSLWNSGINKIVDFSSSIFGSEKSVEIVDTVPQNNSVVEKITEKTVSIRDCGVTDSPSLNNKSTYENNAVLNCLGDSALRCEDAKAVIKDALFPNMFQIIQNKGTDTCNFRLSYAADSILVDITGKKLALQYISCPISIVKAVDETKTSPVFNNPSIDNADKYASQIYFYGTLGLFIENDIDQDKIKEAGCTGDYIATVLSSYRKMQSKN